MIKTKNIFSGNRKGLSDVVTTVLMIALGVAMIAIVWVIVNGLVKSSLSSAGSCVDTFDKVKINSRYTCYNSSSKEFQFSIDIRDISVDEVVVGISAGGSSVSFRLNNGNSQINNLSTYPNHGINVSLPGKNAGLTYLFNMSGAGFSGKPDSIRLAPVMGTNQCEATSSLEEIDDCNLLVP